MKSLQCMVLSATVVVLLLVLANALVNGNPLTSDSGLYPSTPYTEPTSSEAPYSPTPLDSSSSISTEAPTLPSGNMTSWTTTKSSTMTISTSSAPSTSKSAEVITSVPPKDQTFRPTTFNATASSRTFWSGTTTPMTSSSASTATSGTTTTGLPGKKCTSPMLVPGEAFSLVWNNPSSWCLVHNMTFDFSKYGIVSNQHNFVGEAIAVLYEYLGHWPQLKPYEDVNGGVPQMANFTSHLQKVREDIETRIPDKDFAGLGVLDMELWRPIFDQNFGLYRPYQMRSLQLVKKLHPDWPNDVVHMVATKDFEDAARFLMQDTLLLARQLRPGAKWGYYKYPNCFGSGDSCALNTQDDDDLMSWMYGSSTGIYPSVYVYAETPEQERRDYIEKILKEGLRVRDLYSHPDTPVVPFTWVQSRRGEHFDVEALKVSVGQLMEMGVAGAVLWGTSNFYRSKEDCEALESYLHSTLGPFVLQLKEQAQFCSLLLCSGHGRCVKESYGLVDLPRLGEGSLCEDSVGANPSWLQATFGRRMLTSDFSGYRCRCFAAWKGRSCEEKA